MNNTPLHSTLLVLLSVATACALEVTNTTDAGAGSLRDAIANTPVGGTVTFAAGVDGGTIMLANGQLVIDKDLIIDASTLAAGFTIDADGASTGHRVLQVDAGVTVQIYNLTLKGGKSADGLDGSTPTDGADGGGILNGGDLTLTGCSIAGNATGEGGEGADGDLSNPDGRDGGHGGRGGGIYNSAGASLALIHCTLFGNSTGVGGDGGSKNPALAIGNGGDAGDGGDGGGIYYLSGAGLEITQCTISGNTTGDAGLHGTGDNPGNIGRGGDGGGVRDQGDLTLNNTLIAGNQTGTNRNPIPAIPFVTPAIPATPGDGPDLAKSSGNFSGIGVNFIGDTSGSSVALTGTILSGDAMITPFGNYGGSTPVMLPLPDSPLIDPAGGDSSSPFTSDQRGLTRVINGAVDIGAVEYTPVLAFEVDTLADENDGFTTVDISLREAIENAASGGTITFAPGVSGGTITLALGQLLVERDLTIDASALVAGITIDANGGVTIHRALQVQAGVTVGLNSLMITGGRIADGHSSLTPSELSGGGIHNSGDLTLTACTVEGNTTGDGGDGRINVNPFGGSDVDGTDGGNGGGIYNVGNLVLEACTINANTTGMGGKGRDAEEIGAGSGNAGHHGGSGGGIHNSADASLTLTHCTIFGNTTGEGGQGGDGYSDGSGGDGGNGGFGGGIFNGNSASLDLIHSTISANTTGDVGFGGSGAGGQPAGGFGMSRGGGIRDEGTLALNNTIISDNQSGSLGSEPDLAKPSGGFTCTGVNFIGNLSGSGKSASSTLLSGDAMLAPLSNYGGGTQTLLPKPGSPVIDPTAGASTSPFSSDQRGFARVVSGKVDIGAVEYAPILALEVDTLVDENDGVFSAGISLRDAIAFIAPGGTITFAAALSGGTITLANGQLVVDKNLTIDASALAAGITIDANGVVTNHRVLQIDDNATVALNHLTLTGGKTLDGSGADGGGIHNSGSLMLTDCSVSANATGSGAGGGQGGGIFNADFADASLKLIRCRVSGNTTGDGNGPGGAGGGIYNGLNASLTLTDCTVSGNVTGNGGGNSTGGSGGGIFQFSEANSIFVRSTISGNITGNGGPSGGRGGDGGGIGVLIGSPALTHCTIAGNVTGKGGGTGNAGSGGGISVSSGGSFTLTRCTVSANSTGGGGTGGGISDRGDLEISNSLIAANGLGSPGSGADLAEDAGSLTRSGINFIGDLSGSGLSASSSLLSGDAKLAPLADYGGRTETMALRSGSPAIDAADPGGGLFDQRRFPRKVGAVPDIGAYESGNPAGYAAWAIEMIPDGLDASYGGDAEGDDSPNGSEYALGTGVLLSDPGSPQSPSILTLPSGNIEITFGFNPAASIDTKWVIKRSIDLVNFDEIYSYHGPSATSSSLPGVSATFGATSITVTDTNPPDPRVFYKFVAEGNE